MVVLRNNFDGGTDGVNISIGNSGAFGQNAFDYINNSGAGIVCQFTSVALAGLNRPTAEYVMEVSTTTHSGTPMVGWVSSLGTPTELWWRFYVYLSALSTSTTQGFVPCYAGGSSPNGAAVVIYTQNPSPVFGLQSTFDTSQLVFTSAPIVTGVWQRIECHMVMSTTSGSMDLYYYGDADSDTYTDTVSLTGQNFGSATFNQIILGEYVYQESTPSAYFSNFEANTTGYPGPAPFRQGLGSPAGNLTNPVAIICDAS